jgi:hypothetical protein
MIVTVFLARNPSYGGCIGNMEMGESPGGRWRMKYVYDLVMYNDVPANKTIRHSLFLPLTLPSERKPKRILPRIGEQDWELVYFKKVGVRK